MTEAGLVAFLTYLKNKGWIFHLDDDPCDCLWGMAVKDILHMSLIIQMYSLMWDSFDSEKIHAKAGEVWFGMNDVERPVDITLTQAEWTVLEELANRNDYDLESYVSEVLLDKIRTEG